MKVRNRIPKSEQGIAIVMVLITAFIGFVMVAGLLGLSTQSSQLTWRTMAQERADAATDAALEAAVSLMVQDLRSIGVAGVSNQVATFAYNGPVSGVVTANISTATLSPFSIVSVASTNSGESSFVITAQTQVQDPDEGRSRARMDLRLLDVPVTGFSLCYDVDLEHYPWHDWTVTGPVYCGQTAYFCPTVSGVTLTFADQVYSVNGIVEGPHPLDPSGSAMSGTIEYLSDKNLKAPVMVQPPKPAGSVNRMHWILERPAVSDFGTATGNQRFFNKADVVVTISSTGTISVNKGPKHGGSFVASSLPAGVMYSTNLYDGREAQTAAVVVLDAAQVPSWMGTLFGGARPTHPTIYVDNGRDWGAAPKFSGVRVENGLALGDSGFTLATPNPLYVRGHFNSTNPKPVMLAGDSVTVLSSAWNDGDGALGLFDPARAASATTLNAAIITGIVPADGSYGSGWSANALRLLENWDTKQLTFNGSMAVLYHSESATGVWEHGTYYRAPGQRTFAFTNFFSALGQTNVPALKLALRRDYKQLPPL